MSKLPSCTLTQIIKRFGGELLGDGRVRVSRIATLESADKGDIAFLTQARYLPQLATTRASAVILGAESRDATAIPRIVCDNPYLYFARVSALLNPPEAVKPGIHRSAAVDKSAKISRSVAIGAHVVIGKNVRIGARTIIDAGCFVGDNAIIGEDTHLHAGVTLHHRCRIGARGIVHSGVVIGADGFGIANDKGSWVKIPQIGGVSIGDDVEIGANTTIDRGTLDDTVIEDGVKLDNLIQIAHNVRIGAHTAIAGCTGIAGSAKIGSHCALGGASMIYGHITIADHVNVSAGTLIMKSLDRPGTYTGVYPFSTHQRWLKNAAQLRNLDEMADRIKALELRLATKEEKKS